MPTNERSSLGWTQGRSSGSGRGPLGWVVVLGRAVVTLRTRDTARSVPTAFSRSSSPIATAVVAEEPQVRWVVA